MAEAFKIGLIGCGTVGQGVVRIIQDDADEIEKKSGVSNDFFARQENETLCLLHTGQRPRASP